jgi:hypothetical protein
MKLGLALVFAVVVAGWLSCKSGSSPTAETSLVDEQADAAWAAAQDLIPHYCGHAPGEPQGGGTVIRETQHAPSRDGPRWLLGCTSEIACPGDGGDREPIACAAFIEPGTLTVDTCFAYDPDKRTLDWAYPDKVGTPRTYNVIGVPCN